MNPILAVLLLAAEIGNVADFIGRNKGVGRYMKLLDLIDEVSMLQGIDVKALPAVWKAMDAVKRAEAFAAVNQKFDIPDDQVEAKIEKGLSILVKQYEVIDEAIQFVKELKA